MQQQHASTRCIALPQWSRNMTPSMDTIKFWHAAICASSRSALCTCSVCLSFRSVRTVRVSDSVAARGTCGERRSPLVGVIQKQAREFHRVVDNLFGLRNEHFVGLEDMHEAQQKSVHHLLRARAVLVAHVWREGLARFDEFLQVRDSLPFGENGKRRRESIAVHLVTRRSRSGTIVPTQSRSPSMFSITWWISSVTVWLVSFTASRSLCLCGSSSWSGRCWCWSLWLMASTQRLSMKHRERSRSSASSCASPDTDQSSRSGVSAR